jgi:hypothetical protein
LNISEVAVIYVPSILYSTRKNVMDVSSVDTCLQEVKMP